MRKAWLLCITLLVRVTNTTNNIQILSRFLLMPMECTMNRVTVLIQVAGIAAVTSSNEDSSIDRVSKHKLPDTQKTCEKRILCNMHNMYTAVDGVKCTLPLQVWYCSNHKKSALVGMHYSHTSGCVI